MISTRNTHEIHTHTQSLHMYIMRNTRYVYIHVHTLWYIRTRHTHSYIIARGSCDGAWCVQVYEVSQPLFLFLFILNKDSLLILIKFLLLRMLLSVANNISSQGPWRRFYSSYPRTSYLYYNTSADLFNQPSATNLSVTWNPHSWWIWFILSVWKIF